VTVAGLVLAAGSGSRFGEPKALVVLDGERLVDRSLRVLREAGLRRAYVVQGAAAITGTDAVVVDNPDWATGMGSSLRAGLAALPADVDAALVLLVDQPGLTAAAVRRVLDQTKDVAGGLVLVATYDGRRGHPVLLGRGHWAAISDSAAGDSGARAFMAARPELVVEVECGDVAGGEDVDTAADLERFRTGRA
jgi:CTP:molybdopterin cytidylyltransferase MocA